jgi:hypothetical protein
MIRFLSLLGALTLVTAPALAQNPYGPIDDLKLAKPEDAKDQPSAPAPAGAIILFDGKNLDGWTHRSGKEAGFKIVDGGAMQVAGGDIVTKQKFGGAFTLHLEFRVPYMPKASGQGRGNSGVYLQGRYEVQVLDSYGLNSKDNDCGGIYSVAAPLVNACKAPTIWQTYDIDFQSPPCADGKKTGPGIISVRHNGIVIHDNVKITTDNTTSGAGGDVCTPGPILLQDHGNPVQYRNIWLEPKAK